MDISIRKNENCIIGFPRCDFVFSSTRTCFIAYGFKTSPMEVAILRNLLESKGIQCEEAGGQLAPGQNAFCQKICSKIITSQFCIVLLNNDEINGDLIPNANVNMEYGLMLGFNKYIIPFQKENQTLPFNVAALDTVKYDNQNFERNAISVVDLAISKTMQTTVTPSTDNQVINVFLLLKKLIFANIEDPGEKNIFNLGSQFGFLLLNDFSGMKYSFLGNFSAFRPEIIVWRLSLLNELLNERYLSIANRIQFGLANDQQIKLVEYLFSNLNVLVIVTSNSDKSLVLTNLSSQKLIFKLDIYSINDIDNELMKI